MAVDRDLRRQLKRVQRLENRLRHIAEGQEAREVGSRVRPITRQFFRDTGAGTYKLEIIDGVVTPTRVR